MYTIKQLSEKLNMSRDYVYQNLMKRYQVDDRKALKKKFDDEDLEFLEKELKKRNKNVDDTLKATKISKRQKAKKLTDEVKSTIKQRLIDAKENYNWIMQNIADLKEEIESYKKRNKTSAVSSGNGGISILPQQKQMESYQKLLITWNKTISDLEKDLELTSLSDDEGVSVFD